MHIEKRKATLQAIEYCKKEDPNPFEFGNKAEQEKKK
jgi:hypothetical protein